MGFSASFIESTRSTVNLIAICSRISLTFFFPTRYVYNVHKENYTGFVEAIKLGTQSEISRYVYSTLLLTNGFNRVGFQSSLRFIPDYMTEKEAQKRLIRLLERDWKTEAAILLEERLAMVADGQEAYVSSLRDAANCRR
jgi:hypothetical protein